MNTKIWLSSPHMGGDEINYINEAFETNWIAPLGPNVNEFEKELARAVNINSVAVLSSGTAAIHLGLIILGVKAGDEVICSSFTFSASANPIVYQGATPVFIDSETETWNMDPDLLEKVIRERIASGRKPKAIITVHLYGMPAKIKAIKEISEHYGIPVVEDAAEALGSNFEMQPCGTFGEMGILSFNGNKIITTSGGGALISNKPEYIDKARFLSTQARDKAPHYQHSEIGYNYRMSNVVAGIGRGQLKVLNERVTKRREINKFYRQLLGKYDFIKFQNEPNGHFSNFWLTTIIIEPNKLGISNETIRMSMDEQNIETRALWKPMHLQPVFEKYPALISGTSERLFQEGLCLPSGSNLTNVELDRIAAVFETLFKRA